jgi:hypothetical protein
VTGDLCAVDEDDTLVSCAVDTNVDALTGEAARNSNRALVEDPADVSAKMSL